MPAAPNERPTAPPRVGDTSAAAPRAISISPGEFFWLTLGVWVGGICILTVLPVLLIPRLGMPLGVAGSYLVFFLAWQPIQSITQRTSGMRAGIMRMVMFVAAAATIAFYLREVLLVR